MTVMNMESTLMEGTVIHPCGKLNLQRLAYAHIQRRRNDFQGGGGQR